MVNAFDGAWKFDHADPSSRVYDRSSNTYVPDPIEDEHITLSTAGGVQRCEVRLGVHPTIVLAYTGEIDSPEWFPYLVAAIEGTPSTPADELRVAKYRVGEPVSYLRIMSVDERTTYRLARSLSGVG